MRLWHKDLIPVLPRKQLLSQYRECVCIARNIAIRGTPNHLLVNKIVDYPYSHFYSYTKLVETEMLKRGYKCDFKRFTYWFDDDYDNVPVNEIFKNWHNDRYLNQCLANLQEKFDCEGIGICEYEKIMEFVKVREIN